MPRLSSIIVDSLALLMVGVCLTSIVVSYERNLPDPAARFGQLAGTEDGWLDPVTTGAIVPKEQGAATGKAGAQAGPAVEPKGEEAIQSAAAGSQAWVDPPRR